MDEKVFKSRFHFTDQYDLHLLREVLGQNPYEDHNRWGIIQINMLQITGKSLTIRTLRERVQNLIKKYVAKIKALEGKSGIEIEVTELDDLLHQIYDLMKDYQNQKGKNVKENIPNKKTSYQNGYEMREAAISTAKRSTEESEMNMFDVFEVTIPQENSSSNGGGLSECGNHEAILPTNDNSSTPNIQKTAAKRTLAQAQLNIATPSRKRPNVKQNTVQYLAHKNKTSHELRCRELTLEEKKLELAEFERKKRLELEERRVAIEERRVALEEARTKSQSEFIMNQQELIKLLFSKVGSL